MRSKIDKDIDRILRGRFFMYSTHLSNIHRPLCIVFYGTNYDLLWNEYWKTINNKKYTSMNEYLGNYIYEAYGAFLRLLIVEDFKKYCKKELTK